jgi:hypothetical protein
MPQKPRLDVVQNKRPLQKRIVLQINLSHRKIVRRPPISMHPPNLFPSKRRHVPLLRYPFPEVIALFARLNHASPRKPTTRAPSMYLGCLHPHDSLMNRRAALSRYWGLRPAVATTLLLVGAWLAPLSINSGNPRAAEHSSRTNFSETCGEQSSLRVWLSLAPRSYRLVQPFSLWLSAPHISVYYLLAPVRLNILRPALRTHIIAAATPHVSPFFAIERTLIVVDELFLSHFHAFP